VSLTEIRDIVSKRAAAVALRVGVLFLLVTSGLLLTGCATVSSDDRDIFYSNWVDPHSNPLVQ
jgi:hypothetical protein